MEKIHALFALLLIGMSVQPAEANSTPEQGLNAAVNAACRYRRNTGASAETSVLYILTGVRAPARPWVDNWTYANGGDHIRGGSYALGFIDWITETPSERKGAIYTSRVKQQCGG